jgi:hypothetical protein
MNIQIDLYENVAYRFYFIEDYSDTESLFFNIQNHAYTDGLNYISAMSLLSNQNNKIV